MMNVADFHTAVSHNLPLTVFVFNDNAVGQERHDLIHKGLPPKYAEVVQPDFEKLAVGFGAKGFRVKVVTASGSTCGRCCHRPQKGDRG